MASETVPHTTLRLAGHFPTVTKKCEKQASAFFECFSTKGVQPSEGDEHIGVKALEACKDAMKHYDDCMFLNPSKKSLVRVQEEYRLPTPAETRSD